MAFDVRSLLPKVHPFRKDLEEERAIFAIQEAVRRVCRTTEYAQAVVSVVSVAATPTISLTSAMSSYGDVLRVELIRLYDTRLSAYKVLYPYNQTLIDAQESYRNYAQGWPTGWTYKGSNTIEIFPTPDIVYTFEVTASYVPTAEITTIPLPQEAEDAIVAWAQSFLLMQPGAGQNLALAKDREILHNRELDFLRASALLGQSGRPRATGRTFATRAIRMYDNRWQ